MIAWPLLARRASLPLVAHLWLAAQCAICGAQIALRLRRVPLAWQEAAGIAYRLNSCGWGYLSVLMKLRLDQAAVATGPLALLWHATLLFFASVTATLMLIPANALRLRWEATGARCRARTAVRCHRAFHGCHWRWLACGACLLVPLM